MQEERKIECPACGAYNHGVQTHCLLCKAALGASEVPAPEPIEHTPAFCTNCGAALKPEQHFCTSCGQQR
jgi:hypothetical protein